jgi:hypothetical protein
VPVPLPFGSLPAALPALTNLRVTSSRDADVSGLTGLRRLAVTADRFGDDEWCDAVEGLSGLAALEDLDIDDGGRYKPLAPPSHLAPLTALTRLAMTYVPPELFSLPCAARLRRLELHSFDGLLEDDPGGGGGSGGRADGAAAAALAALARGAPLLERLRIHGEGLPDGATAGAPLGVGIEWPSLAHLQLTPWAAVLLAGCTFPRLSRLVAKFEYRERKLPPNDQLQAAVAALAAKARDHAALRVGSALCRTFDLAAVAAVPGLRHLSWSCGRDGPGAAAGDWARLAPSLDSLELEWPLAACQALTALTGLTRLFLYALHVAADGGGLGPVGTASLLARLPRLAHLRLLSGNRTVVFWVSPAVAAELARCPALRLLELEHRTDPLWRHEIGPADSANPRTPRPSAAWPPFAEALRAGGCRATVRPIPRHSVIFGKELDVEI